MARKTGQIIGRAPRTWVVRVYVGRDAETKKRKYLNKTIHGGLRAAQAHLNRLLGERGIAEMKIFDGAIGRRSAKIFCANIQPTGESDRAVNNK